MMMMMIMMMHSAFIVKKRQTGRRMIMSRAFRRMPAVDLRRVQTGKQGKTALCLIHVASLHA
jgi:hypothetical protein